MPDRTPENTKKDVGQIGAVMSDLVAHVHAFVTEGETGPGLEQRVLELVTSTGSLLRLVERVAKDRGLT